MESESSEAASSFVTAFQRLDIRVALDDSSLYIRVSNSKEIRYCNFHMTHLPVDVVAYIHLKESHG